MKDKEIYYGEGIKPTITLADNVKIYGQKKVPMKFNLKTSEIKEAHRWFQNGDHPKDNYNPPSIKEGELVRRYRNPYVAGELPCEQCECIMHDHGWIDCGKEGVVVCPGDWVITTNDGNYYTVTDEVYTTIKEGKLESLHISGNHLKYINVQAYLEKLAEGKVNHNISPKIIVELLNELLELDREAITELFSYRVKCNKAIADHPTVQIRGYPNPEEPTVGLLGIINGFFESCAAGIFPITMEVVEHELKKFTVDYRIGI